MAREYSKFYPLTHLFMFIGLFLAWQIFGPVFRPIHLFAINLLYPEMG